MSNVKKEEINCVWCQRGLIAICEHTPSMVSTTTINSSDDIQHTTYKTEESLKDQQSTGRKRAAALYPLNPDAFCEWAGQNEVGGGQHPIKGCGIRPNSDVGYQQCRHHGPDKNVLNNEKGNVHRICTACHNEWHGKNDADYLPGAIVGD